MDLAIGSLSQNVASDMLHIRSNVSFHIKLVFCTKVLALNLLST